MRYGGVIVFFDEADSLGSRGGAMAARAAAGRPGAGAAPGPPRRRATASPTCRPTPPSLLSSGRPGSTPVDGPEPPRAGRDRLIMGWAWAAAGMGTLQALLTELSGLKKPRGFLNRVVRRALGMRPKPPPKYRILVMMATNMPQALDEALLRPGPHRPHLQGRLPVQGGPHAHLRGLPRQGQPRAHRRARSTSWPPSRPTPPGATIKDLVNEALIIAIRDGRDAITWPDVIKAKQLKDLGPPEDVEYIERERHAVAVHEACHAVAAYRVRRHLTIDIATIEKGGTYLGMVASIPPEDQFTQWRSEYEADIMVSPGLAGRRADVLRRRQLVGRVRRPRDRHRDRHAAWRATGAWATHRRRPTRSRQAARRRQADRPTTTRPRHASRPSLGRRVEDKLQRAATSAPSGCSCENRSTVLAVAHALETHKTLTGDDIEAIIEGREGRCVDGRPYHTPEFATAARGSTTAGASPPTRRHGKVDVALPRAQRRTADRWLPDRRGRQPSRAEPPVAPRRVTAMS